MDGRINYLVVGAFVSVSLAALILLLLSLAGDRSDEASVRYIVFFERDVSGLTLGAPVRYLGVDVGAVSAIRLSERSSREVRVDIEVRESTPVSTATFASLTFQGVTGVAFVSLGSDEREEEAPLRPGGFEYPVIPVRNTGLAALLASGPEISDKVSALLDRGNDLLRADNRESVARSLESLVAITSALAEQRENIATLPGELRGTLAEIGTTLAQIQSMFEQVEPNIVATMDSLTAASADLANVSARLDRWLEDNDDAVRDFVDGGLGQTAALVADTRETVRELEKLLADVRENPSRVIYKPQTDAVQVDP